MVYYRTRHGFTYMQTVYHGNDYERALLSFDSLDPQKLGHVTLELLEGNFFTSLFKKWRIIKYKHI